MRRHQDGVLRPGWQAQIVAEGLVYHESADGRDPRSYWTEAEYYSFTAAEVERLASVADTLFDRMLVEAGDHVIANKLYDRLSIPQVAVPAIERSWHEDAPSVYGRFDLRYGNDPDLVDRDPSLATPKLLEFNADTPTSLLESAVIQWNWLLGNDAVQHRDQWNNIYDALTAAWTRNLAMLRNRTGRQVPRVHFTWTSLEQSGEDKFTVLCLADAARAAGVETKFLHTEDIRLVEEHEQVPLNGVAVHPGRLLDQDGEDIDVIFKLYPWEDLARDRFGPSVLWNTLQPGGTVWVEPPYKMLWSNKGILAVLWELFGGDAELSQYLLPTYFLGEEPAGLTDFAQKPLFGREGASVRLVQDGRVLAVNGGPYGSEGSVRQQLAPLPDFHGVDGPHHPVVGVWMVDGEAAGLGIRESATLITDNRSSFVPHCIID
ncbi:glutathionylspermidine synthase family protein [Nakamurella leprariae]|uniref:Glutathionylspermidine synthase family protein n=1 Tax=Nakamurella leprariae TaxID=2803911 RepID=A0A939BZN5_9ACTN|nr:glutathionylspermidine synthase family protein [Nakamurella leprariae]MBM9468355.1 glutathionylspermidine synthase family protein [Nakamurella leprariae]